MQEEHQMSARGLLKLVQTRTRLTLKIGALRAPVHDRANNAHVALDVCIVEIVVSLLKRD